MEISMVGEDRINDMHLQGTSSSGRERRVEWHSVEHLS